MSVDSDRVVGQAGDADLTAAQSLARPLNEVAFGVRFVAPDFDIVQFGQYFEVVKQHFSQRQMVAAIASSQYIGFGAPIIQVPSLPRLWLTRESRLLQLQVDRFVYNWRRVDDSSEKYPGFDTIFAEFRERWTEFLGFSDAAFSIPIKLAELSLTYVNQIHDDGAVAGRQMFAFRQSDFGMPEPELWVSQLRFAFPESNKKITVGARPAIHLATQSNVTQLDMTVESIVPPNDLEDVLAWYSEAHDLVHRTFKTLIGPEWLTKWGFVQ